MFVGGFQYQDSFALVFRFNSAFARHLAFDRFAQQVTDALDARCRAHISEHPLHCTGLRDDICFFQVTDDLPFSHAHSSGEIGHLCRHRSHAEIIVVFNCSECTFPVDDGHILVVGKVPDRVCQLKSLLSFCCNPILPCPYSDSNENWGIRSISGYCS